MPNLTEQPTDLSTGTAVPPGSRLTAIAFVGWALCVAVAETILGDLDQTDNYAAMVAAPERLIAAGLLHLLGAVLLGVGAAGAARFVWRSPVGRVAVVLLAVVVPCGGAFAQFHLALAETTAAELDPAAMEQFVLERTAASGAWGLPVVLYAVVGFLAVLLLLVALARVGATPWLAPAIMLVALVGEMAIMVGLAEIIAHWLALLAWVITARGLWGRDPGDRVVGEVGVAENPS